MQTVESIQHEVCEAVVLLVTPPRLQWFSGRDEPYCHREGNAGASLVEGGSLDDALLRFALLRRGEGDEEILDWGRQSMRLV